MSRTLATAIVLVGAACSSPATALPPHADAARTFRPVSALFFLPDRMPTTVTDAALVPDSKILWDLTVTAKNLGLGNLEISVRKQHVTIDGAVSNETARATLLKAANRTPGVRSVRGNLEVPP